MAQAEARRAVVIGGGLAGLSAAVRLCDGGWRVKVLESQDRVGGRCQTVREGEFLFDCGAQHFHDSYDDTLSIAINNGLGGSFRIPEEDKAVFHKDGLVRFIPRDLNPMGLLPWKAMGPAGLASTLAVGARLARKYRAYNLRFPFWWKSGDDVSAHRFLSARTTPGYRRDFAEPVALYATGAEPGELSAAGMMVALRYTFMDRTGSFTGGMGSLPEALADKPEVITGMKAVGVERDGRRAVAVKAAPRDGGRVRTYRADAVICAVPAPLVEDAAGVMGKTARRAIDETAYSEAVVVNLGVGGVVRPGGPILLPRSEGFHASWLCASTSKAAEYAPEGSTVITTVFRGDSAKLAREEADSTIAEQARKDAARAYGGGQIDVLDSRVDRHDAAAPVISKGHSSRVAVLREDGSGIDGLYLAGDWTMSPTVEGAVASGLWAAEVALARSELST